ncbi:hypothetical protein [Streptomyces nitrosporeus]|uniref:hypothetical protein n=1 Tax=Streptomyces nitrosporeus TaxID=28894 RepID=UPI0033299AEA
MFAQPDGSFKCKESHTLYPSALNLGPDQMWVVTAQGSLARISTPASALRRMVEADREHTEAVSDYAEIPPLLDLRAAAFDFVAAMALGLPYPTEVPR